MQKLYEGSFAEEIVLGTARTRGGAPRSVSRQLRIRASEATCSEVVRHGFVARGRRDRSERFFRIAAMAAPTIHA